VKLLLSEVILVTIQLLPVNRTNLVLAWLVQRTI